MPNLKLVIMLIGLILMIVNPEIGSPCQSHIIAMTGLFLEIKCQSKALGKTINESEAFLYIPP